MGWARTRAYCSSVVVAILLGPRATGRAGGTYTLCPGNTEEQLRPAFVFVIARSSSRLGAVNAGGDTWRGVPNTVDRFCSAFVDAALPGGADGGRGAGAAHAVPGKVVLTCCAPFVLAAPSHGWRGVGSSHAPGSKVFLVQPLPDCLLRIASDDGARW